jgi:hypothetical protein
MQPLYPDEDALTGRVASNRDFRRVRPKEAIMVSNWKYWQITVLVCVLAFAPWLVAAFAPWLVGRVFDPGFLVASAVLVGLFVAIMIGAAALVKLGAGLFKSTS